MKKIFNNFWFWNTEPLTRALRDNLQINEGLYGLFIFFTYVGEPLVINSNNKNNYGDLGNHNYYIAVEMLLGYTFIYFVNKKLGNKDFLKKVICLSLPISLRFMLISVFAVTLFKMFSVSVEFKTNYMIFSDHLFNLLAFLYLRFLIIKSSSQVR